MSRNQHNLQDENVGCGLEWFLRHGRHESGRATGIFDLPTGLCDEPPADTWPRIVLWQDLINYREGLDAIGTGENLDIIGDCQPGRRVGSCNELH